MDNRHLNLTLFNGQHIPVIGLGTWQCTADEVKEAVNAALETGYRHIDTAYLYQNEAAIGQVIHEWINSGKLKRQELFITTKLPFTGNKPEKVEHFLKLSLENLKLDYVDLYLIQFPIGFCGEDDRDLFPTDANGKLLLDFDSNTLTLWKAMESQVDAGRAKAIGLSNFNSHQIERIVQTSRIKPANLQVEMHAYFQQKRLRTYCKKHGIIVCAYGPLGSKGRIDFSARCGVPKPQVADVLDDPMVAEIANAHSKTSAQVLLRHLIQLNVVVIPKSVTQSRIRENYDVFDFVLTENEMEKLSQLDKNNRTFIFDEFDGVPDHPEYPFVIPY
ncbi:1,5-anhydro-D-fructose reductase-like [Daphnia carinata]|uniref:1,5-anhydro-D-fructose reductase-like n=1 Tax=Daphnia carinata TaxID=120202 RepID=UPI00257FA949|nr:1,5-anhydro-D-fructose reductase-like [Daphnia carinata]